MSALSISHALHLPEIVFDAESYQLQLHSVHLNNILYQIFKSFHCEYERPLFHLILKI